jgi:PHD/YefM family antitoxin component YafN of YafNO toxin-antitoxin module
MVTSETTLKALDDILDRVSKDGPQTLTRHKKTYVILDVDQYEALTSGETTESLTVEEFDESSLSKAKYEDFLDFLLNGPRFDGVVIERDPTPMRDVEL